MNLWWLSFCDASRPKGSQFLGACISRGETIADACAHAHALGCNPGGEVMGAQVPESLALLYVQSVGVLMDRATCEAFDAEIAAIVGPYDELVAAGLAPER